MEESVHTIPVVDGDNLRYFKELYLSDRNARELIESLATREHLDVDHFDVAYSQIIHRSIEATDLVRLQSLIGGEREANVLDSLIRRKRSNSVDTGRHDRDYPRRTALIEALDLAEEVETALQDDLNVT